MKRKLKAALAAAAVSLLLAACGGDSSGDGNTANPGNNSGSMDPSVSVQSVFDYIASLIATDGENSPPRDVNALTLATDETSPAVQSATVFTP